MHRLAPACLLLACASAEPSQPPPAPAPPAHLLAPAASDGVIVSTAAGLDLLSADLRPLAHLADDRGRHLRLVGDRLYWFDLATPQLRALDLRDHSVRTIAALPPIDHPRFPATADPLHHLAALEVTDAIVCLDLRDVPGEAATAIYNDRIDLATGAHERRLVMDAGGDQCGVTREAERPRLCTPAPPPTPLASPTGLVVDGFAALPRTR